MHILSTFNYLKRKSPVHDKNKRLSEVATSTLTGDGLIWFLLFSTSTSICVEDWRTSFLIQSARLCIIVFLRPTGNDKFSHRLLLWSNTQVVHNSRMNHTGLQAYVHRFRLKYFPAISTPSYNLSSIVSFIPGSQFLTKGNEPTVPLNVPEVSTTSLMAKAWPTAEVSKLAAEKVTEKVYEYQQIPSFPSPWEFFTSGYIVGLMIMVRVCFCDSLDSFLTIKHTRQATLLHRIQNVVIPSSRRARHAYRNPLHQTTPWERFLAIILPLDFSRTSTRLVFHLPSLYFLSRMLIIWILLILQTCEVSLSFWGDQNGIYAGHLDKLTKWVMHKEMTEICWSSFCTVCGASLLEGLIKALDRLGGGGLPPGAVNNLSPFHLVSALLQSLLMSFENFAG